MSFGSMLGRDEDTSEACKSSALSVVVGKQREWSH